ncbi:hypothetical protein BCR34DRAFT_602307 [Clohesyomyces aquaticus]|uniref:Uncharacterized protein n=1 Tax=Clohesyomyces aquaticus TaxID=1231657 RepID=A0A1Y1ZK52_9PLEO|nr:hypothetical protein BCR34DRAFT_602307 [Clohesyomyces aquaticus]
MVRQLQPKLVERSTTEQVFSQPVRRTFNTTSQRYSFNSDANMSLPRYDYYPRWRQRIRFGSVVHEPPALFLPCEILFQVASNIEELSWLWTHGRQVCKSICLEIESLFRVDVLGLKHVDAWVHLFANDIRTLPPFRLLVSLSVDALDDERVNIIMKSKEVKVGRGALRAATPDDQDLISEIESSYQSCTVDFTFKSVSGHVSFPVQPDLSWEVEGSRLEAVWKFPWKELVAPYFRMAKQQRDDETRARVMIDGLESSSEASKSTS